MNINIHIYVNRHNRGARKYIKIKYIHNTVERG